MEYFALLTLAILYIPWVFICAWLAGEKGRSRGAWGTIAFLFSPYLTLLALIAVPPMWEQGRK